MLFKKKAKPVIVKDHFSANAITARTRVLRERAESFADSKKAILEETAKVQLIFPFFKEFGWDASDPSTADLEVIAGEKNKADMILKKNGTAKVVVEAKAVGTNLADEKFVKQLAGYFENCYASVGILTDGIMYHFYSYSKDSDEHMNLSPFAVVDIRDLRLNSKNGFLLLLCKPNLDIDRLIRLSRTKYTCERLKPRKALNVKDRATRDAFIQDFPECTPQELDELIAFANYHRNK